MIFRHDSQSTCSETAVEFCLLPFSILSHSRPHKQKQEAGGLRRELAVAVATALAAKADMPPAFLDDAAISIHVDGSRHRRGLERWKSSLI